MVIKITSTNYKSLVGGGLLQMVYGRCYSFFTSIITVLWLAISVLIAKFYTPCSHPAPPPSMSTTLTPTLTHSTAVVANVAPSTALIPTVAPSIVPSTVLAPSASSMSLSQQFLFLLLGPSILPVSQSLTNYPAFTDSQVPTVTPVSHVPTITVVTHSPPTIRPLDVGSTPRLGITILLFLKIVIHICIMQTLLKQRICTVNHFLC